MGAVAVVEVPGPVLEAGMGVAVAGIPHPILEGVAVGAIAVVSPADEMVMVTGVLEPVDSGRCLASPILEGAEGMVAAVGSPHPVLGGAMGAIAVANPVDEMVAVAGVLELVDWC